MTIKTMTKRPLGAIAGAAVLALASLWLSGCGGGNGSEQLPPNSSVQVRPQNFTWNITPNGDPCIIDPNLYQDQLIAITVVNGNGNPISKAKLLMSLTLSGNTFSGFPVLELYSDSNGNGVAEANELVSDVNDSAYETITEDFSGERLVIVRANLSCPFSGSLLVFSDGFLGTFEIDVVEDAAAPAPAPAP